MLVVDRITPEPVVRNREVPGRSHRRPRHPHVERQGIRRRPQADHDRSHRRPGRVPTTALPQAVLTPLTAAAIFLVVTIDLREVAEDVASATCSATSPGLERTVGFQRAIGQARSSPVSDRDAWGRLFDGPRPAELHPFVEVARAAHHHAVATPGDLLFHIHAAKPDLCFELASLIMDRLAGSATGRRRGARLQVLRRSRPPRVRGRHREPEQEPRLPRRRSPSAPRTPTFAGASYVIVQKYLHDLEIVEHAQRRGPGAGGRSSRSCRTWSSPTPTSRATPTSR